MKGILQYNLPEEQDLFERSKNVMKYYYVIEEHLSFVRDKIKYEHFDPNTTDELIKLRDNLINLLESYGIYNDF